MTNKSLMFIQRNTKAVGNDESRQNLSRAAVKNGRKRKGEKKPWLSEAMKQRWRDGMFDFHKGRERPAEEIEILKASFTPERRRKISRRLKEQWQDETYRDALLEFHRSDEERKRRSHAQTRRMRENPEKWTRGCGQYVIAQKENREKVWVRSSYEAAAVRVLDADSGVVSYCYEPHIEKDDGFCMPDFVVEFEDRIALVEVKAAWVLDLPATHDVRQQLEGYEALADESGWDFEIWTEEDRLAEHV